MSSPGPAAPRKATSMLKDPDQLEQRLVRLERQLEQIEYALRTIDLHIAAIENSIVFRILRRFGRPVLDMKTRAVRWLHKLNANQGSSIVSRAVQKSYTLWAGQQPPPALPELTAAPSFHILLRLAQPKREWLEEAIASVSAQTYANWRLTIFGECDPALAAYLASVAASEPRIVVLPSDSGTADDCNRAVDSCKADYLMVLRECDRLAPDALH